MKLIADLHAHTPSDRDVFTAISAMAEEAKGQGIKYIALTDHAPTTSNKHNSYLWDDSLIKEQDGVAILRGAEADIMNYNGDLAFGEEVFGKCHIVLAALHTYKLTPADRETHTNCFINAIKNPIVDILAHPGDNPFDMDEEAVIKAAVKYKKAVEFAQLSLRDETCHDKHRRLLALAQKHGCMISVSSDAQRPDMVGRFDKIMEMVKEAGIGEEQIINASKENLVNFLKSRGKQYNLLQNVE